MINTNVFYIVVLVLVLIVLFLISRNRIPSNLIPKDDNAIAYLYSEKNYKGNIKKIYKPTEIELFKSKFHNAWIILFDGNEWIDISKYGSIQVKNNLTIRTETFDKKLYTRLNTKYIENLKSIRNIIKSSKEWYNKSINNKQYIKGLSIINPGLKYRKVILEIK